MVSSLVRGAKNELYQYISYANENEDAELIENFKQRWSRVLPCDTTISLDKFQLIRTLGRGSFGRVVLALLKNDNLNKNDGNKLYAIKVMDKRKLVRYKQIDHTLNERRVLYSLQHPNTVRYFFSFKDNSFIYLSLEYIGGGDLFTYLRRTGKFNEKHVKFYAAQIFLVFEYLHHFDILYRDLKPENILIAENGYLKVTDFGFAKHVNGRTYTLCGTPDYLPPEIIKHKGYGKSVDWWTFAVLCFEMAAGQPPFSGKDHIQLYEAIVNQRYTCPSSFSAELTDLIKKILVIDVTTRLGCLANGNKDIQNHPFFDSINFIKIYHQSENPNNIPYKPAKKDPLDPSSLSQAEEPIRVSRHNLHEDEFRMF
ncbi:unnamed protein product [Rotaria sp. Silwood1]|nr:unnamed protein product [Rotaria sp. Silwood1]CAF1297693.1 unnamed protein product [Rotaria sp. Silwood1]CAF1301408.1 unnamed protein product [Rotaria sp. Silwood1]CAF3494007.1 unnamed protein product [Rotaria sp. Silwood1]CAF3517685.1 unnamed protein product [Rotaria sp. Silwood1]